MSLTCPLIGFVGERSLEIAKQKWQPGCTLGLFDLVQEGNAVLDEPHRWRGQSGAGRCGEVKMAIQYRDMTIARAAEPPTLRLGDGGINDERTRVVRHRFRGLSD
jgi:hypothetical protein